MENTWFDITCIEECASSCPSWGGVAIETDQDCCPEQELSQICGFYIDPCCQNPITAWNATAIIDWAAANVDNTDTTGTKVKYITVEGGIDQPTPVIDTLPKGKEYISAYDYSANFERRCVSDAMNDFMRHLQKGNPDACIWYETLGGYIYGGLNGIKPKTLYAVPTNGSGVDDKRIWTVVIQYRTCVDPPRILNPLAS